MLGQQLVDFRPSFDRAGFLSRGANVERMACAVGDQFLVELMPFPWFLRYRSKALMTTGEAGEDSFDTDICKRSPDLNTFTEIATTPALIQTDSSGTSSFVVEDNGAKGFFSIEIAQ